MPLSQQTEKFMPFRSFRLALRFVLPLALVLGIFAYAVVPVVDNMTLRWFVRDLDARSQMLSTALQDPLQQYIPQKSGKKIIQLFERTVQDGRLFALGFCDAKGKLLYKSVTYPAKLGCPNPEQKEGMQQSLVTLPQGGSLHVPEPDVTYEKEEKKSVVVASSNLADAAARRSCRLFSDSFFDLRVLHSCAHAERHSGH